MEILKNSNSIFFSKPFPAQFIHEYFKNESEYFTIQDVEIIIEKDERNEDYVKSVIFSSSGEKSQYLFDTFLRWISLKIRIDEFVWAYQIDCVIKEKVKLGLNLPSMLPMIGNVMLSGLILANVKNLDMNQRKFTIVQIDNDIRIVKRDDKYIGISQIKEDLKKLLFTIGNTSILGVNS